MSDFLSNFDKKNYQETKEKKQLTQAKRSPNEDNIERNNENDQTSYEHLVKKEGLSNETIEQEIDPKNIEIETDKVQEKNQFNLSEKAERHFRSQSVENKIETDSTYDKKKKRKRLMIFTLIAGVIVCLLLIYYQNTHVKVPDFKGKEISEARTWATENKMTLKLDQEYSMKNDNNQIIAQKNSPGKKIKKGSSLEIKASLGPDPEEKLTLPDFMKMSKTEAEKWIKDNKASSVSIVEQYSEEEAKGKTIRSEIVNKEVNKENYKRKDKVNVYYSKGKEVFERNIPIPDFAKKTKSEVQSWAKTNEINMTYEEDSSSDIPLDSIISQSIPKDDKIAKKDNMSVKVSLGKGFVIPDFSQYSQETAGNAIEGVTIQAKSLVSETVPYGELISQSVAAGTLLNSKDELKVTVDYSAGRPYLKDLRGNTVEGELPKYFFEEFQSKGAAINYTIRYIDSEQPKGMVVGMSKFSQYIPLTYTVAIDVSLGNLGNANEFTSKGQNNLKNQESNEPLKQ